MRDYIAEQPEALRRLMNGSLLLPRPAGPWQKLWFVGSGTSLYAGMVAANLSEALLGADAEAISSQEFLRDVSDARLGPGVLAVAISQSGATVVLTEAMARARRLGATTVGVTAQPDSPLAQAVAYVVPSLTGPEDVPPKTKGFTSTAFAACLFVMALAGTADPALAAACARLPEQAAGALAAAEAAVPALVSRLAPASSYFVVGTGTVLPAALEGALKVLESAKLMALGLELEEVLHGYFNAIGPETGLILLARTDAPAEKLAAFTRAAALIGAPLVTIAEPGAAVAAPDLLLPAAGHPGLAPLLAVLPLQVLAYHLAQARGKDPDRTRYPELYPVFRTKTIYM